MVASIGIVPRRLCWSERGYLNWPAGGPLSAGVGNCGEGSYSTSVHPNGLSTADLLYLNNYF